MIIFNNPLADVLYVLTLYVFVPEKLNYFVMLLQPDLFLGSSSSSTLSHTPAKSEIKFLIFINT